MLSYIFYVCRSHPKGANGSGEMTNAVVALAITGFDNRGKVQDCYYGSNCVVCGLVAACDWFGSSVSQVSPFKHGNVCLHLMSDPGQLFGLSL